MARPLAQFIMDKDLKKYCEHLNLLAKRKPNDKYRKEVLEASKSKWEGVQVKAAQVFSEWGDKESLEIIKSLLIEKATTSGRFSATSAIAKLLYTRVTENDIDWVIDLYLKKSHPLNRFVLLGLVSFLPKEITRKRLKYYLIHPTGINPKDVRAAISIVERE